MNLYHTAIFLSTDCTFVLSGWKVTIISVWASYFKNTWSICGRLLNTRTWSGSDTINKRSMLICTVALSTLYMKALTFLQWAEKSSYRPALLQAPGSYRNVFETRSHYSESTMDLTFLLCLWRILRGQRSQRLCCWVNAQTIGLTSSHVCFI